MATNNSHHQLLAMTKQIQPFVTTTKPLRDGYDLPLYGLDGGHFVHFHATAITFMTLSLLSAIVVIIHSFRWNTRAFFSWTKSERFAVYLAICDGLFNICHLMDHLHIFITQNHVYPKQLCTFYGFMLIEFINAQNLLVNIISINGFVLIYFRKHLNFGQCDWKLSSFMLGVPFVAGVIAVACDVVGSNGAFCFMDGVKGEVGFIVLATVPLTIIFVANCLLYALTWYRIRIEEPRFKNIDGNDARIIRASCRAARNMCLFVSAFFIQWSVLVIFGIWQLIDKAVPQVLFFFVISLTNCGGALNAGVYFIIKHRVRDVNYTQPHKPAGKIETTAAGSVISLTQRKDAGD